MKALVCKSIRLLTLCALSLSFVCQQPRAAETVLSPFVFESSLNASYTEKSWSDKVLVVFAFSPSMFSREGGSTFNKNNVWTKPFAEHIASLPNHDVAMARVVDLNFVPSMFQSTVQKQIVAAADDPIKESLLDWQGLFSQRYELDADAFNLLVFGKDKHLALQVALHKFDPAQLATLLEKLTALTQ